MLEFLGFIALLAIIFGISFSAALVGFLKFVVVGIGVIIAIAIVAAMVESKKGATCVLVASIIAAVLGLVLINDDYNNRYNICSQIQNELAYVDCVNAAVDTHNGNVNMGWGLLVAGGIAGIISASKQEGKKNTKTKAKTR